MRDWLERVMPGGVVHTWLVDGTEAAFKVVLALALYVLLRWAAHRTIRTLMGPLIARERRESDTGVARMQTLEGLCESAVTYVLLVVTILTLFGELGINITALLTGAGVAGLALSFGAQRLVRDVLTGFFILLEDQFRVGEVVTLIGGAGLPQLNGTVLEMGLRVTRLRDLAGKVVTIGNGDIAAVINHHRGPVTATVEVGVPNDLSLEQARQALEAVSLPADLFTGRAQLEGVSALDGTRAVLRVAAPAAPGKAPVAELVLREAVGEALRGAEIALR